MNADRILLGQATVLRFPFSLMADCHLSFPAWDAVATTNGLCRDNIRAQAKTGTQPGATETQPTARQPLPYRSYNADACLVHHARHLQEAGLKLHDPWFFVSARNLGNNLRIVAWTRSRGLFELNGEEAVSSGRVYTCLCKTESGLAIDRLTFSSEGPLVGGQAPQGLLWACSGQELVWDGKPNPIERIIPYTYDLRHVWQIPVSGTLGSDGLGGASKELEEMIDLFVRLRDRTPEETAKELIKLAAERAYERASDCLHNAVGITQDGREAVFVQCVGTFEDVAGRLIQAGAWRAIELDQGGSCVWMISDKDCPDGRVLAVSHYHRPRGLAALVFRLRSIDDCAVMGRGELVRQGVLETVGDETLPSTDPRVQAALDILRREGQSDWRRIADAQPTLKRRYFVQHRERWAEVKAAFEQQHGAPLVPPFDLDTEEWRIDRRTSERYGLPFLFGPDMYQKFSQIATAGVRHLCNPLAYGACDPTRLYSDAFVAVHACALAKFLKTDIYPTVRRRLDRPAKAVARFVGAATVRLVEDLFGGMKFDAVIRLLKRQPVFVLAGETRPHTARWIELQARILASAGITVVTTKDYRISTAVNIVSLLTQILGASGGGMWTSSHSSVETGGFKIMGPNGGQLLPETYEALVRYCTEYVNLAMGRGLTIKARRDHQNIFRTITHELNGRLLAHVLKPSSAEVESINTALSRGFPVVVNSVNGAGYRNFVAYLRAIGVSETNLQRMRFVLTSEEGPESGFVISKGRDGLLTVLHDGSDMTRLSALKTVPYHRFTADMPVGTKIWELDNDADRFTVGEIVPEDAVAKCKEFALEVVDLGNGRAMARYSPNKGFLTLDRIDFEQEIKAALDKGDTTVVHLHTVVSGETWKEFDQDLRRRYGDKYDFAYCRVGFKNLKETLDRIEKWFFNSRHRTLTFVDQAGVTHTIRRRRRLLILSLEEESGGRGSGYRTPLRTLNMENTLASPEKSAIDSASATFAYFARQFLNCDSDPRAAAFSQLHLLEQTHAEHRLRSRVDERVDVRLTTNEEIGRLKSGAEYATRMAELEAIRDNQCNFWLSLARCVQLGGETGLHKVRQVLNEVVPEWAGLWLRMTGALYMEEPLPGGQSRPEGAYFRFEPGDRITALKFRASATDITFGLKYYLDSDGKTPAPELRRQTWELLGERLIRRNLYPVLERHSVPWVYRKSEAELAMVDRLAPSQALYR
ncbi:MAG: hypothetical protein QHJ82_03975 [Verrucomicrobiota bacterium]|nr:hypothetical protein [Verrucomicrobiota bacterium]